MKRCLAKLNAQLREFNTSDVVEAANVYRSRGVEDKAANIQAVDDHLRDLRQQKKRLEADILAQWEKRDPEGFALKGETESEIRTREALQAKESETSRKRDAPDASGFTLTGSDRQVDEAEARGQKPMFARTPIDRDANFKAWFGDSKVVDENGKPLRVYHGTKRPDRVGGIFRRSRATSGPMAFFTSDPTIASNYSTSKGDTSLANEDQNYENWFKVKVGRSNVDIVRAWFHISAEERARIASLAPRVARNDDGDIILEPEGHTTGIGGYDWHIKEARGNHLKALVEAWLNGGTLYDDEETFLKVLSMAGMKTPVEMDSPHAEYPAVYPVYLAIERPINTEAIPDNVITALEKRANRQRKPASRYGADQWAKETRDAREWVSYLKEGLAEGTTHAWTSIPDWVTDTLKSLGYDGIQDTGGKNGGMPHGVWIPFREEQVKSATGNKGTFDPSKKNILFNRAETKSSGMSVADIRAFIEPIVAKWANAPDVTVIASMEDAPKSVRQMDQKQLAQGATGRPFAFFHGGQVFIIASEIRSEKQALEGLYHEALGHYGLRGVFGDKLDSVLLSLASARSAEVAAKAKAYGLDILKREDKLLAAEEVLAELAQKRPEIGFVRKAIAAIRSALREMGVNLELTDDEIIRTYILPAREFVERGNSKSAMSEATFARRLFADRQTKHDFIVPETPEFAGNTTGDLAMIASDAPYIESLPIRLTVGEHRGSHRGFGIEKLEAGAKANPSRAPDTETGERAEDWARNVVKIALGTREMYVEDNKIILRDPASKKALVLERRNDARWGDYYSVVSLRPAATAQQWGRAVWAGRGLVQPFGSQQPGAPDQSPESESLSSDRQSLGVQTTKFDFTGDRPTQQDPTITYKSPKKKIDPTQFARTPEWIDSGSAELKSAAGKIDTYAPDKSIKDKVKALSENWAQRAIKEIVDPYIALKKLSPNAYILARMVKSADTSLEATLRFGVPVMNEDGSITGTLDSKGFLGHMSELNGEHDRFFMWVAGNRAERLMGEGKEHLFSADEIKAMKGLIAGKMKDGSPRPQAYAKAATALRTYNKAFMDIAEKSGEINGESRKMWEHDFYIPFFRVDEDMKIAGPSKVKGLARNEVLKRLKGGTEPLGDLLDNTIRNWQHILSASLANQAAKTALKAAVDVGIAVEANEETAKQLEKAGGPTAGATYVMDDGEKHWYTVGDPFVLEAISSLETPSINWAGMKLMRDFKRILTMGVTASPTFRVRNLARDSSSVIAQNEISYNLVKNVYQGYKATDHNSATYAQAMFGGGIIRFGNIHDGKHAEHAKRLILSGVEDKTILDTPTKVRNAIQASWDWYQENGDRFENTNRMALIQQRLAAGDSNLEAMFAGRDSMDFTLVGANKAVQFLTQVVPFLNARLQGLYKTGRAGVANPKRLAYVTGALTLASVGLLLAYKDDEEWKKRADWDRDTYFWFRIGNTAYRIPKGFELGGLASLAERGVEMLVSDEMNGKRLAERLWFFVGNTLSLNPIPQIGKPLVDLYANTDSFTGRQIETRGMENLSKPERVGRRTSLVAKTLGKAGNVTQLSPAQIDHLIQAYFGWVGTHAAMTVDLMAEPFLDVPKPARKVGDVFVVGDFVKDLPSSQSRYVEDFYKQTKKVQEVMGDLKQARDVRDADKVRQILEDKRDEVSLRSMYANAQRTMTDINHKIKQIERSSGVGSEEKRERIDEMNQRKHKLAQLIAKRTQERQAATQ